MMSCRGVVMRSAQTTALSGALQSSSAMMQLRASFMMVPVKK
jgi:hypothetical protein